MPSTFVHLAPPIRKKKIQLHNFSAMAYNIAQRNISYEAPTFVGLGAYQCVLHAPDIDTQTARVKHLRQVAQIIYFVLPSTLLEYNYSQNEHICVFVQKVCESNIIVF